MPLSLPAPAKFNRYLGVLGRRPDGFHEVELVTTVLEGVSALTDTLTAEPWHRLALTIEGPTSSGLEANESNLVLKAWRLVEALVGRPCPAKLTLQKRIPHGAGLGGGSSDAAAALRLINAFLMLELQEEVLLALAAELGSDIPLFILGGTVHGTGRGEKVKAIEAAPLPPLLLVNPGLSTPTPAVYKALSEVGYPATRALEQPASPPWQNDLEAAAINVCPMLEDVKNALLATDGEPLLCGSGSTWAARYTSAAARDAAQVTLSARPWSTYAVG